MIHRSYRSLLLTLTRNFCKDNNQDHTGKTVQQPNADRGFKNKKHQGFQNKYNEPSRQQTDNQQQRQPQDKSKKLFHKDKNDQEDRRPYKKKNLQPIFDWEKSSIDPSKLQQIDHARDNFNSMFQKNALEDELFRQIGGINEEQNRNNLLINFDLYFKKDFNKAKEFFVKNLLTTELKDQNAQNLVSQLSFKIVKFHIQSQNPQELLKFLALIPQKLQFDNQKLISSIQLLSELEQSPQTYKVLAQLLKQGKLRNLQPDSKKKIQVISRRIIQNFASQAQQRGTINKSLNESFQLVFENITKLNLLPSRYIKSPSFQKALLTAYFHNISSKQSYNNFFRMVSTLKTTITTQDDYLEQFFNWMLRSLEDSKLTTTDSENPPFLVTPTLIQNYEKYFTAQNKEVCLTIVAICLVNRYLSIPEHFLQEHNKNFKGALPNHVIARLREHVKLLQLDSYVKSEKDNQTNKANNEARKSLQIQLNESKQPLAQLKISIMTKNYEKALKLFNKQHFRQLCIQRERLVISAVLFNFFSKEGEIKLSEKELTSTINQFVKSLSEQYLWESWRKSEDLGFLLEDYYIKEDGAVEKSKEDKRFSFWDSYFEVKRAKQINRFQLLGELSTIKEPNQSPYIETQFNLNKYLTGESFERYRQVTDYHNQKDIELIHFLYKLEAALLQIKSGADDDVRASVMTFQNELCEENLKYIDEFGLKDYDINVHDPSELLNRMQSMKKVRGITRLESIYDRVYKNQKEFEYLATDEKKHIEIFRKTAKLQAKRAVAASNAAAPEPTPTDQAEQTPKQEGTQQAVQEQTMQPAAQQPQQAIQAEQGQLAQQGQQQPQESAGESVPQQGTNQTTRATEQPQSPVSIEVKNLQQKHISLMKPQDYVNELKTVKITKQLVDILRVKRRSLFTNAAINAKLNPDPVVNQLMRWGLLNRQPMAIYMGEKLAMLTKQIIPHRLAIRVSDMFSYNREIDEKLFADCKLCLSHIGKIDREFIYDDSKIYQHILYKPMFNQMTATLNKALFERLEDMILENPRLDYRRTQPRELERQLNKSTPI